MRDEFTSVCDKCHHRRSAKGRQVRMTYHNPTTYTDMGLVYGDDFGICDYCGGAEAWADLTPDWNGETGCHYSCEDADQHKPSMAGDLRDFPAEDAE